MGRPWLYFDSNRWAFVDKAKVAFGPVNELSTLLVTSTLFVVSRPTVIKGTLRLSVGPNYFYFGPSIVFLFA